MEDWQKLYNAWFNTLAVKLFSKEIKCENCGCDFSTHRYNYSKDKNHTYCASCKSCTWFKPFGYKIEKLFPFEVRIPMENRT